MRFCESMMRQNPAYAGMDPSQLAKACRGAAEPRLRGDGPDLLIKALHHQGRTPPTRGWTRIALMNSG